MEQAARWSEQNSSHSQELSILDGYSPVQETDQDLLARIRSLLLSRNSHYPPRTPRPSPDFSFSAHEFDAQTASCIGRNAIASKLNIERAIAKLAQLGSRNHAMVAKPYDELGAQTEGSSSGRPRRHPSQPNMQDSRRVGTDDTVLGLDSSVDHRSSGTTTGRDLTSQAKTEHDAPKMPSTTHIPRYVLRTVHPTNPNDVGDKLRPISQHVPGSYRSEVESSLSTGYGMENSMGGGNQSQKEHEHSHSHFDALKTAFEALSEVKEHHPSASDFPSIRVDHAAPDLASKTSQSTLRSNLSAAAARHPLLQPTSEFLGASRPAEPVLSPSGEHTHSCDDGDHPVPQLVPTTPLSSELANSVDLAEKEAKSGGSSSHSQQPKPVMKLYGLNTEHVAKLLANLPPVHEDVMNQLRSHQQPVNTGIPEHVSLPKNGHYSPSIYSRRSSLRFDSRGHSRRSSRSLTKGVPGMIEEDRIGLLSEKASDTDAQSTLSDKISTFSRALSQLSEVSLRPMMPSTTYGAKQAMDDFENEAVRGQSVSSLFSTEASGTINHSPDEIRLAQPPQWQTASYRRPSTNTQSPSSNSSENKQHWVRHLLGRRSPTAVQPTLPILTAMPQRRYTHHMDMSTLKERANLLPFLKTFEAAADGSRSQRPATDSTDPAVAIRSQQANNDFSTIISELENLLKEALSIARQAADKEEHHGYREINEDDPMEEMNCDYDEHPHFRKLRTGRQSEMNDPQQTNETTGVTGDQPRMRESVARRTHSESHVIVVEPEKSKTPGLFKKARDATPYPSGSVAPTRHASIAPGTEILYSTTPHARAVADHLSIPRPEPITGLSDSETMVHFSNGRSSTMFPTSTQVAIQKIAPNGEGNLPELGSGVPSPSTTPYPRAMVLPAPQRPLSSKLAAKEQQNLLLRDHAIQEAPSKEEVRKYISSRHEPPIQPRSSSARLRKGWVPEEGAYHHETKSINSSDEDLAGDTYLADFHQPGIQGRKTTRQWIGGDQRVLPGIGPGRLPQQDTITSLRAPRSIENGLNTQQENIENTKGYSLKDRHHFSIRGPQGFSLSRSHRRAPIARDWSTRRKRWVATVTCINTALLGILIGIYAGEVPAIQYALVDQHHYAILGNVLFYIGMAVPTILFFPLPLLHGRKPYTIAALGLLLPLQFPQAVAVGQAASPYMATYRMSLLLSRAFTGFVAGFAQINLKTTLLDLFGASLQSGNPHQETVNQNDVRRHGGGMGVWLGIWTWCSIGSIGVGFLIGAGIIDDLPVTWGFWISIIITAAVLLLNVMTPEVRRSPYRRSMAEVNNGSEVSRRIARGEIKMHLYSTGPKRWWEEVVAGHVLCIRMLKQPGFVVLSLYMGWIYGQVVMVIVLLGALMSKYYQFHSQYVGLCVSAIPIGALLAVPFQKASLFSRARHHAPRTDSMTFEKRVTWTTHLLRRAIFMIILPFAGLAYTLASGGTQISFIVPTIFAGVIGFLSNLAIAECNGIIMETFDTSDLQPGMTGRPRRILPEDVRRKRTNFSCFPRVTAAFAITQTFSFAIAATATGVGGVVERALGAQAATGVVSGVLLILTLLLIGVLTRFKTVQIVPIQRYGTNVLGGPEDEWKPVIIGNPSGATRRISILEMGEMTRWSEIRRRNRLLNG